MIDINIPKDPKQNNFMGAGLELFQKTIINKNKIKLLFVKKKRNFYRNIITQKGEIEQEYRA
jgi:hypothetical protein